MSDFYSIKKEGQTKIHTIRWKVPNFENFLADKVNNTLYYKMEGRELRPDTSNEPIGDIASDSRFQLKMQILARENGLIGISYLSSIPVENSVLKIINYKIPNHTVFGELEETVLYQYVCSNTVRGQANKWQRLCILNSSSLPSLPNFHLKIEFFVKNLNNIKFDRTYSPEVQLSNDFEYLLNNNLFYDVTMKSAEGVEYKVHKVILASRSAVLKAHFEHKTTECYNNIVESPLESDLLREVLKFIYSGKAARIDEIPEKLLVAADYYQLSHLKSLCEEALQKKLTVENAIETLELADLHSANALKQVTLGFIKDGRTMPAIIKTERWAKLKSAELIKEICEYGLITADGVNTTWL